MATKYKQKNYCWECNCSCFCNADCDGDVSKCTSKKAKAMGCKHCCACLMKKRRNERWGE